MTESFVSPTDFNTQFLAYLTNAAGTVLHNLDYSGGSAQTIRFTPANDCLIYHMGVYLGNNTNVAQYADIDSSLAGVTTISVLGLNFAVRDNLTDTKICTPFNDVFGFGGLILLATIATDIITIHPVRNDSATATQNGLYYFVKVNFVEKFGKPLFLPVGTNFATRMADNYTGLSTLYISLSGHYVYNEDDLDGYK